MAMRCVLSITFLFLSQFAAAQPPNPCEPHESESDESESQSQSESGPDPASVPGRRCERRRMCSLRGPVKRDNHNGDELDAFAALRSGLRERPSTGRGIGSGLGLRLGLGLVKACAAALGGESTLSIHKCCAAT